MRLPGLRCCGFEFTISYRIFKLGESGMAEDWLDKLFNEKQTTEESRRLDEQKQLHDAAKLQALLPDFWQSIIKALQSDLERYNQRVNYKDRLYYRPLGSEQFLVEKQSHPPAGLKVWLNKDGEKLKVQYESVAVPEKNFQIRLGETNLYLESAPGKAVPAMDISPEILEVFFRKVQSG